LARFIGGNSEARLAFIRRQIWLAPFIGFLGTVGILQPIALSFYGLRTKTKRTIGAR
jgi:biopolymer transport protein ExbB/TolQ